MLLLRLAFLVFLIGCCLYAFRYGGRPERQVAGIMFAGALLSFPAAVMFGSRWTRPEIGVFAVDLLVLAALLMVALRADRFWPLWATSCQLIAVMTHVVTMIDHDYLPQAYSMAQPFWAYPALLSLALGARTYRLSLVRPGRSAPFLAGFSRR